MAAHQPTSTAKTKPNRLPAPALFVGPPSRNASALSVARPPPTNARQPSRPHSPTAAPSRPGFTGRPSTPPRPSTPTRSHGAGQGQSILDIARQSPELRPKPSRASLDAQWTDMQRTLDEVENAGTRRTGLGGGLSAGTTLFGTKHGEALKSLREAQIRLAEAWGPVASEDQGKDEGKEGKETKSGKKDDGTAGEDQKADDGQEKTGAEKAKAKQERRQRDGEQDLRTAAERRERNEEYFAKVKAGVEEVVARLGEVSKAMQRVEGEGREIWEDSSIDSGSKETLSKVQSRA